LLLAGGSCDAMSKVFEELGNPVLENQFLFYTFICAFLMAAGLAMFRKEKPGKIDVLYGILIGVPNYFSARFILRSLTQISAVIVYPTYSVGTIIVVTLIGMLFFKEKLGKKQKIALTAILIALVMLNV
jgi:multidrug transporter EmrE-like cation transporter